MLAFLFGLAWWQTLLYFGLPLVIIILLVVRNQQSNQ